LLCSYDANRDKFIDSEDLNKIITKLGLTDLTSADSVSMIKEVDEDGDGKLSLQEVSGQWSEVRGQ